MSAMLDARDRVGAELGALAAELRAAIAAAEALSLELANEDDEVGGEDGAMPLGVGPGLTVSPSTFQAIVGDVQDIVGDVQDVGSG